MDDKRAALRDHHIKLLRLVAAGITTSKALARETGLKPNTIDTYLHAATRALDAGNREDAARRFIELERLNSQSTSQLRTRRLAGRVRSGTHVVAITAKRWVAATAKFIWHPVTELPRGGLEHAYSWKRVGLEMVRVSLLGMVGLFTLVLFVLGFLKTFK